ncbi:MAG: ferrous iron transport protein B [Oscillospiraceae bacterium]|nr:ferrous iron transport protein B [Oscillospiraceae bacterium]
MERSVALAGAPNVGKSTLFNRLTGMRQHTGNWVGKTVELARGRCGQYRLTDLPGTFSLSPCSGEEQVARDFLRAGEAEAVVVVCDAGCLERDLMLALECRELCPRVLLCVNLLDEAERRGIRVDCAALSDALGMPAIGIVARRRESRGQVLAALDALLAGPVSPGPRWAYPAALEAALARLEPLAAGTALPGRYLCLRLLEREALAAAGLGGEALSDAVTAARARDAGRACAAAVTGGAGYSARDLRIDRALTGRWLAFPALGLMLLGLLELTIHAANVPAELLSRAFAAFGELLERLFAALDAPGWLQGLLLDGAYGSLSLVVSVMLPPLLIFFPLFALLEDLGVLPRVAYVLDRPFRACGSCGKQSLCMMMGLGCNAVGVTGARIVGSRRERLLAQLTNAITPCNGRFPLILALLGAFFGGADRALLLALVLLGSLGMSLAATALLSRTLLRGRPSPLVLELPPYRRPQLGKLLARSLLDRTGRVLGRAAAVSAPAGAILWILAQVPVGDGSLLTACAGALDGPMVPFGLDGAIALAFLLGLPANETVLPILLAVYGLAGEAAGGSLPALGAALTVQGWTPRTAVCVLIFTLLHWPCSTTLLTIRRETGSWRWTALSAALPTALGLALCALVTALWRLLA